MFWWLEVWIKISGTWDQRSHILSKLNSASIEAIEALICFYDKIICCQLLALIWNSDIFIQNLDPRWFFLTLTEHLCLCCADKFYQYLFHKVYKQYWILKFQFCRHKVHSIVHVLCLLTCFLIWSDLEKALAQMWHWNVLSPACFLLCLVSSSDLKNL